MEPTTSYTPHHPRWYRERMSTWWWVGRWPYLKFILREISSVFVAWFVVLVLLQVRALGRGPQPYAAFEDWLRHPWVLLLNTVSFFFVLFHSITWFNLAPQAMPVRVAGRRLPDALIAGSNYVAWLAISLLLGRILMRGGW